MPRAADSDWCEDARQDVALWLLVVGVPNDVATDPPRAAAYLRGVFQRKLLDILRREARHAHAALDAETFGRSDGIDRDRLAERVHATLARMREHGDGDSADLLERRFIDRRSVADLAAQLGKPPKSVSAQIQRSKQKFLAAWLKGGAIERQRATPIFCATFSREQRLPFEGHTSTGASDEKQTG